MYVKIFEKSEYQVAIPEGDGLKASVHVDLEVGVYYPQVIEQVDVQKLQKKLIKALDKFFKENHDAKQ